MCEPFEQPDMFHSHGEVYGPELRTGGVHGSGCGLTGQVWVLRRQWELREPLRGR